eukprot:scaffold8236_cov123-Isochrysis_galbana.AAC.5
MFVVVEVCSIIEAAHSHMTHVRIRIRVVYCVFVRYLMLMLSLSLARLPVLTANRRESSTS